MRVVAADRSVITITATRHEITTIVAAARMALELLNADINAPADARAQLTRALRQYDGAIARVTTTTTDPYVPAEYGPVRKQ